MKHLLITTTKKNLFHVLNLFCVQHDTLLGFFDVFTLPHITKSLRVSNPRPSTSQYAHYHALYNTNKISNTQSNPHSYKKHTSLQYNTPHMSKYPHVDNLSFTNNLQDYSRQQATTSNNRQQST